MPLQEDAETCAFFAASIRCEVGNRTSTLFWLDPWLNDTRLSDSASELFAAVALRAHKHTMAATLAGRCWIRDTTCP